MRRRPSLGGSGSPTGVRRSPAGRTALARMPRAQPACPACPASSTWSPLGDEGRRHPNARRRRHQGRTQSVEKSRFSSRPTRARAPRTRRPSRLRATATMRAVRRGRGRADGQAALAPEHVFNAVDNPTWLAPRALDAVQQPERLPVELSDHGQPPAVLLDARPPGAPRPPGEERRPGDDGLPDGVASKVPWDVQLNSAGDDQDTMATVGNNVDDARVWSGSHGVYGNAALVRATSATRDYQPAFTDAWYTSGCNPPTSTRRSTRSATTSRRRR